MGRGARSRHGSARLDETAREQLRREARVVGLPGADAPTLEAVERRRRQLWALSTILLVLLSASVAVSSWATQVLDNPEPRLVLRVSLVVLTLAFVVYCLEKEAHLRRLSRLLLDEQLGHHRAVEPAA